MFDLPIDLQLVSLIIQIIVIITASFVTVKIFNRIVVRVVVERAKGKKGPIIQVRRRSEEHTSELQSR